MITDSRFDFDANSFFRFSYVIAKSLSAWEAKRSERFSGTWEDEKAQEVTSKGGVEDSDSTVWYLIAFVFSFVVVGLV